MDAGAAASRRPEAPRHVRQCAGAELAGREGCTDRAHETPYALADGGVGYVVGAIAARCVTGACPDRMRRVGFHDTGGWSVRLLIS
jgi:hypothetical protein